MIIRAYNANDLEDMIRIWNEVVEEGIAFPQEECLDNDSGAAFFASQSYTGVAEQDGNIMGLYILHPNNVGRCGKQYPRETPLRATWVQTARNDPRRLSDEGRAL